MYLVKEWHAKRHCLCKGVYNLFHLRFFSSDILLFKFFSLNKDINIIVYMGLSKFYTYPTEPPLTIMVNIYEQNALT